MATLERARRLVIEGRDALDAHRWEDAFDLLTQADTEAPLGPEDLEALASAAWFTARADLGLDAKERAFKGYSESGDQVRAAYIAFDIAREYGLMRKFSIASAWMNRGERLVHDQPETYAHGFLALCSAYVAEGAGDRERAIALAGDAVDIGARHGHPDLQALALIEQGGQLIAVGRTDDGFPLMEEATVAAVNGELTPFVAGVIYCSMIAVCRNTTDYRRAGEWTEAAHRWCERQAISGFPGVCRVHRAEIEALQGGFEQAERALIQATEEIRPYHATPPLADGFYALGEVRLRMGDLQGAEDALRQAHSLGHTPHPALGLLLLVQGKVRAAATAIDGAVAELASDRWTTARLLPAQVEIAVAAGEPAKARTAAEGLDALAETFASPALHASRHDAWGRVLLAEGEPEGSIQELRTAIRYWQEVNAPYEIARDRVALSSAMRRLDRDEEAALELQTARGEFERLGAARDLAATEEAIRGAASRRSAAETTRKAFVFTDMVNSTPLVEALGDDAWEHLLRWHDSTLRSLFARYGGEVVNRTGDGFFVAFDSARAAIECAVAIQRALADHRRTHGFAPGVRVGVHAAEANRRGDDYSGMGVHIAARIAAQAGAGEVLASATTVREAQVTQEISRPTEVSLKGLSEPVEVVSIAWS